ncbi:MULTISPECIES: benzoate/H(+) symporter BenE family transporter [Pseudomonas]|uniref:Benzoate/H(+) symporter BenE family transporter n=1 Tax=Pseudomonas idahonensis TaxID=2942628 RepID=A0ABT5Q4J5_9PSED|nr:MULTISPECIES: benzoate/H(+) symporter BenE family transporter [Pseudomonas]MBS7561319.1 benzoate/H(+) symporter BenE family transporter [Pseudomonas sp. RC4D1]MCO7580534.1 benzoate/H(+) symporter BenE family transporter [Pseudomonas protegens]MCO7586596.1 benzoate/H(+) symporter BenE family transporter [Pseudomonas chlororaphis]MCO7600670.1 benzoate/H(+) symporter BenE family transporter [Pseudomonas chlororaphis]MCY7261330.1 benzoate/H(+) symporter BenE family transporter [Pseudomonas prot
MHSLSKDLSLSAVIAGLIAVIISYAGPLIIVFQAAREAHLPSDQVSSWIWAISIGSGLTGLLLSWRLKVPVITAWSTPGAALLVSMLPTVSLPQAIGAYIVASLIIAVVGLSGAFDKLMSRLPKAIAAAMLAGILFRFGAELFTSVTLQPALVLAMIAAYLLGKRFSPRYAILAVLLVGCAVAAGLGNFNGGSITLALAKPIFTAPEWSWHAIVNIGLPLALVTLTGQYVPGMAVMRSAGYTTPARSIVSWTAITSALLAPFGSHGINLAAITAAICTGREAHEDKDKRYIAGIACGLFYILMGIFGATLASVFAALPKELIAALAGLALFGAISAGLSGAMADEKQREAALITFLVTASGMSFLGLAAAFWGLIFGLVAHFALSYTRQKQSLAGATAPR